VTVAAFAGTGFSGLLADFSDLLNVRNLEPKPTQGCNTAVCQADVLSTRHLSN